MGKNNKNKKAAAVPSEEHLFLPAHAAATSIVDTHTHLVSTFAAYKSKYPAGQYETIPDFVRNLYRGKNVEAIVDVWCEAPVQRVWKEIADMALSEEIRTQDWGGLQYYFVMGE